MSLFKPTINMWKKRWEKATAITKNKPSTQTLETVTINPITWVVFIAALVIDLVLLPIVIVNMFLDAVFTTLFGGNKMPTPLKAMLSVVVGVILFIVGVVSMIPPLDGGDITTNNVQVTQTTQSTQTPQPKPKTALEKLESIHRIGTSELADMNYLKVRIDLFQELGSGCFEEEIQRNIKNRVTNTYSRIDKDVSICTRRIRRGNDKTLIEKQNNKINELFLMK